jgi:dipeptidyl aminopeptidase/acylaminoacyl peptidase
MAGMYVQKTRPSRIRWVIAGVIAVAIILSLAYAVASLVLYNEVGRAPRACHPVDAKNTPAAFEAPDPFPQAQLAQYRMPQYQEVRFASRDPQIPDAKLAGWWVPGTKADAPAVVIVHGIQSCRRESAVLLAAGMLHRAGFSVLLMDLRDHGDSEGDDARFSGGSKEYMDVLGGWDWVRSQGVPAERIGIAGMSFGSISSLIAGGEEPAVPAVWADSGATRLDVAIGNFLVDQIHDPTGASRVLVPGGILWAKVIANDDLVKFNPIDEVAKYRGRALAFVHGEKDAILPAAMSQELHDAAVAAGASSPDVWVVPGAGHTQGIYFDPKGYEARLVAFFKGALWAP